MNQAHLTTPIELCFRLALVQASCSEYDGWSKRLGLKSNAWEGLEDAFDTMASYLEDGADSSALEQAERSVEELGTWRSLLAGRAAAQGIAAEDDWESIYAEHLEGPDTIITQLMRALRLLQALRVHEDYGFAGARAVAHDDLLRQGTSLMRRSIKLADKLFAPLFDEEEAERLSELRELLARLEEQARAKFEPFEQALLGLNAAPPLTGAATQVRAQRNGHYAAPAQPPAPRCSQWSVGASGNRRNHWAR
ncbi:MAG: hypothetical protein RBU37_25240 [Myxococcota bacterium]|jgi:hypothetical protein|nr:hypothetical protein [Myxococcota bacterium]